MPKPVKEERPDRHSATGLRGEPKKAGHSGKGGWGKAGDELDEVDDSELHSAPPPSSSPTKVSVGHK
eukprot:CAMPEP_0177660242 /NCGR_PEP_ID=MMETSP0447-20121125/17921_1 /TAXON_ID=0 /ORGANISM="Stygamoeba regulata, Strain BSH-02190019" /LENGTH=66 /DNA_ID=CAMNT_0019165265 /DNA_START=46 /DNA_END=246 /DNA_ORIENTATION=+